MSLIQVKRLTLQLAILTFIVLGNANAQQIKNAIPDVARPLPLSAVRLTGGPLKHAQELDAEYLLKLEPDRMLAFYRKRAGLEPKAQPYGGWDGDGKNLTGHIGGHYLSGVSMMYAATGDARFKERVDYIVREFKEVQDKHGDGYLGALANGKEQFIELSKGNIRSSAFDLNGLWSPWYVLHKTYAGLRDAYRYTGNRAALDIEIKFSAWAEGILAKLDDAQTQKMLNTEFGGMNEVLADLYADTGDKRWLQLSHRFDHRAVLDPLARGQNILAGLHGNTQVPKIQGSLVRYTYTGDKADGDAAHFFWDIVALHRALFQQLPFTMFPVEGVADTIFGAVDDAEIQKTERMGFYGVARKFWSVEEEHYHEEVGLLVGAIFVLGQAAITQTVSILNELRRYPQVQSVIPKSKASKLIAHAATEPKTKLSKIVIINAVSNYFKHVYEWPEQWSIMPTKGDQAETTGIVLQLGMKPGEMTDNLLLAANSIGLCSSNPRALARSIQEWREGWAKILYPSFGVSAPNKGIGNEESDQLPDTIIPD